MAKVCPDETKVEKMKKKVRTDIPEFDQLIEGGFLPNQNILLSGVPGSGKSIFGAQFIYNGAKNQDEAGVYVSTQETREKFYANMLKFGMDFEELEKKGKIIFIEQQLTTSEMYDVEKVVAAIEKLKAKRVVYDSINIFDAKYPKKNEQITQISEYMRALSSTGSVVLWTTENKYEEEVEFDPIAFLSDGIISFRYQIDETENSRHISVIKLRGIKHDRKMHPMKITKKGIFVSREEEI